MRELTYYVAVSLDGFIAGPEGQFDAFPVEGDHMEAITERFPDTVPTDIAAASGIDQSGGRFDTVLMGWNTYAVGLAFGVTSPYRHLEQIVFTRTHLDEAQGGDVHPLFTDADPVDTVRELKQRDGRGIWLCGGGRLATALAGEIDRLVLKRNPVLLGAGIPLFEPGAYDPRQFDVVETTAFRSGVVLGEYVRRAAA
ncbi:dihydrofolate reductase family protein [Herbiconiux sp. VKM Ac-2851]|uniref:dihydrofolate reductase family protein n=1 Tax=Herbiconiux sp. VKM Ac-2851 TaxID=2739025 RepID=UPI00156443A3|nr:dihydrofolate reductase family protein [Herbiconiux sp. VKM Ac-2851]NQX36054.1 dihydrofolate reductase family protein [Herbiconiux sp. VKM Ac-2851]